MRFGHCEKGLFVYIIGLVPLLMLIYINKITGIPFWYSLLLIISAFMTFMGLVWIIIQIRRNRLGPLLDNAEPTESVAVRITKDGVVLFQFVPKGLYGVGKTLIYGEDADFIDTGDFPLKTINGSPAILIFDWLNNAIDVRRSVARKHWRRVVNSGPDAYKRAKAKGKVDK